MAAQTTQATLTAIAKSLQKIDRVLDEILKKVDAKAK